jgi:hypothetical protein
MNHRPSRLFFDANDYKLLGIVNDILKRDAGTQSLSTLMAPHMHPHGIKEMAAPSGLRIAYANARLLGSLEAGKAKDRIIALRCLHDEVVSSAKTYFARNTARVLVQIMKELVRHEGDELKQLQLAHDFRMVSTGKPRLVRAELEKYHLLEMPEEWNQFAFDDHVHDANTKGRKSPTHLLMDAWIKGIRKLTVVYYNHIDREVAEELLEAGSILGIHVRIGIEIPCQFRHKFVRIIWELEGFFDNHNLLGFLSKPGVEEIMAQGRQISNYQQQYVFDVLKEFNTCHRAVLDGELALESDQLDQHDFLRFVGTGQPSLLHLATFIQNRYRALHQAKIKRMREDQSVGQAELNALQTAFAAKIEQYPQEMLINRFLHPSRNPNLHNPFVPQDTELPPLMCLSPPELLNRLTGLHSSSRFTLNLSNLTIQDTLELLYICQGRITHIEAFNLKDFAHGMTAQAALKESMFAGDAVDIISPVRNYQQINSLQRALNEDNAIALKRAIRSIIWDFEQSRQTVEKQYQESEGEARARIEPEMEQMNERKEVLLDILVDIESFHNYYNKRYLGSRIGSGSTGQSQLQYGMGLVALDTVAPRVRDKVLRIHREEPGKLIPVTAQMVNHHHTRTFDPRKLSWLQRLHNRLPGGGQASENRWQDWSLDRFDIHPGMDGNVATLGGFRQNSGSGDQANTSYQNEKLSRPHRYLNTNLRNTLLIIIGFIPAFLTFSLTKDWWVLAYLGAFIWFAITGVRNIIQSILGGGGLRRSPLLPRNTLVSWSRIAESLFFTGFSVPLLDYLVKTLLLEQQFAITTATNPVLLYSVMALANGIYITSHNILRGLPRSAAVGNFFRSILSIPLAILFNAVIGSLLHMAAVPGVEQELQKWAAVISKLASDCVAGVIEGLADRQANIRMRLKDYRQKTSQMFAVFARIDVLFPEEDVLDRLLSPKKLIAAIHEEAQGLKKVFIVNALDLMYIWMYQPRARKALEITITRMSTEEWLIFYRSQLVLKRKKEISRLFVDGLVGRNFAGPLSFYLDRADTYLADMEEMGRIRARILKKEGRAQTA